MQRAQDWGLLPGATYFSELLDKAAARESYFQQAWGTLARSPLLFFDPDNGIEVRSVRYGNRRSSKYTYWTEIEAAYARRHSLVLYQHFPREERVTFIQRVAKQLEERLKAPPVDSFRTAHVVFFLVSRREHLSRLRRARDYVLRRWREEIKPVEPA